MLLFKVITLPDGVEADSRSARSPMRPLPQCWQPLTLSVLALGSSLYLGKNTCSDTTV